MSTIQVFARHHDGDPALWLDGDTLNATDARPENDRTQSPPRPEAGPASTYVPPESRPPLLRATMIVADHWPYGQTVFAITASGRLIARLDPA